MDAGERLCSRGKSVDVWRRDFAAFAVSVCEPRQLVIARVLPKRSRVKTPAAVNHLWRIRFAEQSVDSFVGPDSRRV